MYTYKDGERESKWNLYEKNCFIEIFVDQKMTTQSVLDRILK